MIKFFRKIRYNLMEQNKKGKYLKYAIGEIILVVIGILIALQINNWNENRKLKTQEIEILKGFKNTMNKDLKSLNRSMIRYNESSQSINLLIDYMESDLPYQDSLSVHFGNINSDWVIRIDQSVFEALKSRGLNLISNDSLQQDIINFYAFVENGLKDTSTRYSRLLGNASENIYGRHFDALWEPASKEKREQYLNKSIIEPGSLVNKMIPRDYDKLKQDPEFMYFLKSLRNQQFWFIKRNAARIEKEVTSMLQKIDQEFQ